MTASAGDHSGTPPVSCLVPAFDSDPFIAQALDSILGQSHRPDEVIVADGGSRDGTREVVRGYGDAVTLIALDDAGPAATRNALLAAARNPLLAFLDADDLWLPGKLEKQVAYLDAHPDMDACITLARNVWSEDMDAERAAFADHERAGEVAGYATITLLAHRRLFDRIGGFREDLWHSDSTEWFIRLSEQGGRLGLVEEVLVHRRLHRTNLSRRMSARARGEFLDVLKASKDRRRGAGGIAPLQGLPRPR